MARRIAWLVAATTSAVVVAFIVPLCFLVANLAEDRGTTRAREQAQSVATLVATLDDTATLSRTVADLSSRGPQVVVVEPGGTVLGSQEPLRADSAAAVERARTEQAAFTVGQDHGLDAVVPVVTARGLEVVVASVPTSELRAGVAGAWATIVALGLGLVALSVAVAFRLGRRTSVPVTDVAEVAHRLREGDSTARAVPGGPPETAELGRALNALADRIHELVAAEREHVADLGHRLRTPVTALRLDTDLVEDDEVARRLRGHVEDLQRSIDDVVHEARRSVRDELPGSTEVAPVVADRVAFWLPLAEDQGRRLDLVVELRTPGGSPQVALAPDDLGELVDTLLDNVFAHTPDGTDARVVVRTRADEVLVVVEDAGPGMPQPYLGRGPQRRRVHRPGPGHRAPHRRRGRRVGRPRAVRARRPVRHGAPAGAADAAGPAPRRPGGRRPLTGATASGRGRPADSVVVSCSSSSCSSSSASCSSSPSSRSSVTASVVVAGRGVRGLDAGARGVGSGTTTRGPGLVVTQTPFFSTAGATQSASWVTVGVGTGANVGGADTAARPRSSGPTAL